MPSRPKTVTALTQLLQDFGDGDTEQSAAVFALVYDELRALATSQMKGERAAHTLQPTALVNEAYLRLVQGQPINFENSAHFFGIAARSMRQVLVDHARAKGAQKRGGDWQRVSLAEEAIGDDHDLCEIIALDQALTRLAQQDEKMARMAELHLFAGFTIKESAKALGVSSRKLAQDWSAVRLWLRRELTATPPS